MDLSLDMNAYSASRASIETKSLPRGVLLLAVISMHALLLWLALHAFSQLPVTSLPVPYPIMIAQLLAPAPQPVAVPPVAPPTAQKVQAIKPAKAQPKPAPTPTPTATPAESRPLTTDSAPIASAAPASSNVAPAESPPAAPAQSSAPTPAAAVAAPISAPRFDAAYLNNPAPVYPPLSRRLGEQGKVMLRVHVSPDGNADEVRVQSSSGSQLLDEAALAAVRKWRFAPARQGDNPVAAWVQVPLAFTLQ